MRNVGSLHVDVDSDEQRRLGGGSEAVVAVLGERENKLLNGLAPSREHCV